MEQGHLAQGEQKQGDDLVFSLHNVRNVHMEYVGVHMSQLLLLGKFEYGGGPIFKVVLEC